MKNEDIVRISKNKLACQPNGAEQIAQKVDQWMFYGPKIEKDQVHGGQSVEDSLIRMYVRNWRER